MVKVEIDINIEEEIWQEEVPELELYIYKACHSSILATSIADHVNIVEISILLTNDQQIQQLNNDYRQINKPTNVLAFPLEEFEAGKYNANNFIALGDIILALDTIRNEANEQGKQFKEHLAHLLVHGTLHLLGYDHQLSDQAAIMEELEIKILKTLDIKNPYAN